MNKKKLKIKVLFRRRQRKRTKIIALHRNNMKNRREIIIDNYIEVKQKDREKEIEKSFTFF